MQLATLRTPHPRRPGRRRRGRARCSSSPPARRRGGADGAQRRPDRRHPDRRPARRHRPAAGPRHLLRQQRPRHRAQHLRGTRAVRERHRHGEDRAAPRDLVAVSDDNTDYTFHLRKGVTFHDGTPFTSAAVQDVVRPPHRRQGRRGLHGRGRQERRDPRRPDRRRHPEGAELGVPRLPGVAVRPEDGVADRAPCTRRIRQRADLPADPRRSAPAPTRSAPRDRQLVDD